MKRYLITILILVNSALANAQQYTPKDLLGRWQNVKDRDVAIAFITDTTGAWLGADGFLRNKIKYTSKVDQGNIVLEITTQLNRKDPDHHTYYAKFINDNILVTSRNSKLPKRLDTSNKTIEFYKKIKHVSPETEMREHSVADLIGAWKYVYKNGKQFKWELTFVNDSTVFCDDFRQGARTLRYVADFNKQPMHISFYNDQQLVEQALFYFYTKNGLYMEYYKADKKPDHFKTFRSGVRAAIPLERQLGSTNKGF